jgi:hypothetical protein
MILSWKGWVLKRCKGSEGSESVVGFDGSWVDLGNLGWIVWLGGRVDGEWGKGEGEEDMWEVKVECDEIWTTRYGDGGEGGSRENKVE